MITSALSERFFYFPHLVGKKTEDLILQLVKVTLVGSVRTEFGSLETDSIMH